MVARSRTRITIDLRGLGPALRAYASTRSLSVSDAARRGIAAMLETCLVSDNMPAGLGSAGLSGKRVKVCVRLPCEAAARVSERAHASGLSLGAYLTTLIDDAPAPPLAVASALGTSTEQLALVLSDLNELARALARGRCLDRTVSPRRPAGAHRRCARAPRHRFAPDLGAPTRTAARAPALRQAGRKSGTPRMNGHAEIDGLLVQWGERLFYPSNRIVRPITTPRLAGGVGERAARVRQRIEATVLRRAPQVMVKVTVNATINGSGRCDPRGIRGARHAGRSPVRARVGARDSSQVLCQAIDKMRSRLPLCTERRTVRRKAWDSNPRRACALAGFQDRCLQPLGQPSDDT